MSQILQKKITRATFKSFINKHKGHLNILELSRFDGMTDCIENLKGRLPVPVKYETPDHNYRYDTTLGIEGVWLVGDSRDYFTAYQDTLYKGIEVSNCCGNFIVAIIK